MRSICCDFNHTGGIGETAGVGWRPARALGPVVVGGVGTVVCSARPMQLVLLVLLVLLVHCLFGRIAKL